MKIEFSLLIACKRRYCSFFKILYHLYRRVRIY